MNFNPNVYYDNPFEHSINFNRVCALDFFLREHSAFQSKCKNILEFGAGDGSATDYLRAGFPNASITIVDIDPNAEPSLKASAERNRAKYVNGDGLSLMSHPENRRTFDLVVAFSLGPDRGGELFRRLIHGADHCLSRSGKVLVTSDDKTIWRGAYPIIQSVYPEFIPTVKQARGIIPAFFVILDRDQLRTLASKMRGSML